MPSSLGPSSRGAPGAVLAAALGWALLLVVLSFVLPLVTVSGGHDGPQPRVTLVQDSGLAGALPAIGLLAVSAGVAVSLGWARAAPAAPWRRTLALVVSVVVLLACLVAAVLTHLAGLLAVPCGVLLVVAAGTAAERAARDAGPAASAPPDGTLSTS